MHRKLLVLVGGVIAVAISVYLAAKQKVASKSPQTCPTSDVATNACTFWSEGECHKGHLRRVAGETNPICTLNGHNLIDVLRTGGTIAIATAVLLILNQKFGYKA